MDWQCGWFTGDTFGGPNVKRCPNAAAFAGRNDQGYVALACGDHQDRLTNVEPLKTKEA